MVSRFLTRLLIHLLVQVFLVTRQAAEKVAGYFQIRVCWFLTYGLLTFITFNWFQGFNWFPGSAWEPLCRGSASLFQQENWRLSLRICVSRKSRETSRETIMSSRSYAQTFSSDMLMPVKEPPSKAKVAKVLMPNPVALFSAA